MKDAVMNLNNWLKSNTYHHSDFRDLNSLVEEKEKQNILGESIESVIKMQLTKIYHSLQQRIAATNDWSKKALSGLKLQKMAKYIPVFRCGRLTLLQ